MRARLLTLAMVLAIAGGRAGAQDELQLGPLAPGLEGSAFFSPYDNLDLKVLAALDQAKAGTTVYMSYYSLSYADYPKMFKKLKDRGVTLKLNFYEGTMLDPTYLIDDELKAAGFDVVLVPNLRSPTGTASMHTKFTVVNDELVVTGSANLSASASLANHEHVIVCKNKDLATIYKAEFEEQRAAEKKMRSAMTPAEWTTFQQQKTFPADWSGSRASALNTALRAVDKKSQNPLDVVKTYFSPDDQCEGVAVREIQKATKSVHVAMYSFVSSALGQALVDAARRGCEVIVVADEHQQSIDAAEAVNSMLEGEASIRYVRGKNSLGNYSAIHHKYAIIDNAVVLGGSFNWTVQANRYNDENLIVIKSKALARRFTSDFATLLSTYDPTGALPAVEGQGPTARVLLCVAVNFAVPKGWEVVVYGDAPTLGGGDPKKGVALRTSRSVEPNWLGSVVLPKGQEATYKLAVRKPGSLVNNIADPAGAQVLLEAGNATTTAHKVKVNPLGVAQLVRDAWKGTAPTFPPGN